MFSHPADFTPVCTTDLGRTALLSDEFTKRGVKVIAVSVDDLDAHARLFAVNASRIIPTSGRNWWCYCVNIIPSSHFNRMVLNIQRIVLMNFRTLK
ncbi:MAG: redoxin domain-containing protein [Bacteroidetes Order II. Incertae sedis bacterium]|nr:redoxin domain-containing protein [Bacteroidetes Order II. bacterium]